MEEKEREMIQQTSLLSYHDILPEIGKRHQEYLTALRDIGHPSTDMEVVFSVGRMDPNYFRPRRNELVKQGVIMEVGKRACSVSGKMAIIWWFA